MAAPTYVVVEGTQVHYGGVTYEGGQTVPFTGDDDQALIAYQVNAGWITEKPAAKKRAS